MKKYVLILCFGLPLMCMGQSAQMDAPAPAAAAALAENFTAGSVNEPQLAAFQQRATQKLQDFYDYLAIVSNPAYEKRMRQDASTQARQLFYTADCTVDGRAIKKFIDSCFSLKTQVKLQAVNIKVAEDMKAKTSVLDNEYYEGKLTFSLSNGTDTPVSKYAYIMLTKSGKQFGSSKKDVWTAYICDIR